jgi:pimeloyl-ACP methyl ester carboxylesterase
VGVGVANELLSDGAIRLRDGRALAFCEWGQQDGPAVLAFHGSPGSRLWWPDDATSTSVRLVTVDRPGYGRSDPHPGTAVGAWPSDVAELTEALRIDRFGVVGWSGGAPYAAAVAAAMPERLTGVCLASSGSLAYILETTARDDEDRENLAAIERTGAAAATVQYAERMRDWAEGVAQDPIAYVGASGLVGDGDRCLFDDEAFVTGFAASVREGLRQGALGPATDWIALVLPWGFGLDDIAVHVDLWHGAQDASVDRTAFERVVEGLADASLTVWPDAGHFGPATHWADVLEAALGRPRG